MVSYIAKATPEIALFAALALGHALGRVKFGTFSLGGVAGLVAVIVLARACGFGKGFAAGIGAGALTQTAMLGTASDAVSRLGLGDEGAAKLNSQMAVGFAITYIFGTVGVIVFIRSVAPRLLG